jgi:hypothetical protein
MLDSTIQLGDLTNCLIGSPAALSLPRGSPMKKKQRLELKKENIRHLSAMSLQRIAGGCYTNSCVCETDEAGCIFGYSQMAICGALGSTP